jgi:hypothetical protein
LKPDIVRFAPLSVGEINISREVQDGDFNPIGASGKGQNVRNVRSKGYESMRGLISLESVS